MKAIIAHIDEELHKNFKMICAEQNVKMGETLQGLVENFVNNHEMETYFAKTE